MTVVTRFAPSPTGYLHIGGARTALFNYLFAKKMGGKMLLRIEDTDRARSTEGAIAAIIDGLDWIGLKHDDEVIYQFSRASRHAEVAHKLISEGKAYNCYCSQEELTAMREAAMAAGKPPGYDGRWRDRPASEAPAGVKPVVRLKTPLTGKTIVDDKVQGRAEFDAKDLDDLILLRSDGTPTYMLAVVVDDHDMGVTHIIRGNDHFTNAARQIQIYNACGWEVPVMAHIPLIHGADGAKLSKRHGALGVEAYREMGYLPAALRNYLLRLGWSHGDQEIFTDEELKTVFSLEGIGKSASRFDFTKLEHMNGLYIKAMPNEDVLKAAIDLLPFHADKTLASKLTPKVQAQMLLGMNGLKERAKTLNDILGGAAYIYTSNPAPIDEKAAALLTLEAKGILHKLADVLENTPWVHADLETTIKAFITDNGLKFPQVAMPLRVVLTGSATAPAIYELLLVLGRDVALKRMRG